MAEYATYEFINHGIYFNREFTKGRMEKSPQTSFAETIAGIRALKARQFEAKQSDASLSCCAVCSPHHNTKIQSCSPNVLAEDCSAKVAVIVPVYNTGKYLDECLCSLLNQSHRNLIIIAVDDGSTDNSLEVLNFYAQRDPRVRVIHRANGGVSAARNTGLDAVEADGTFTHVWFFDSDDIAAPNIVSKCLQALRENKAQVAIFGWSSFDKKGIISEDIYYRKETCLDEKDIITDYFDYTSRHSKRKTTAWLGLQNKIFDINSIKDIRFDEAIRISEDMLFFCDFLQKRKCGIIVNNIGFYYRTRASSASHSSDVTEYQLTSILHYAKNHEKLHEDIKRLLGRDAYLCWWRFLKFSVITLHSQASIKKARTYFKSITKTFGFSCAPSSMKKRTPIYLLGDWAISFYLTSIRKSQWKACSYPDAFE